MINITEIGNVDIVTNKNNMLTKNKLSYFAPSMNLPNYLD